MRSVARRLLGNEKLRGRSVRRDEQSLSQAAKSGILDARGCPRRRRRGVERASVSRARLRSRFAKRERQPSDHEYIADRLPRQKPHAGPALAIVAACERVK